MALTLDGISIQGFGSYVNDQAFTFPKTPGLYMLTGPTGVGKSTLFNAVRWAFTGATATGLHAKQIKNWRGDEDTVVCLDIRVAGRLRNITRRQSPNSLTLQKGLNEPETIEQPAIDLLVGTTANHVLDAVYVPQRGSSFMDIGSTKQAARVAETLCLARWDERTDRAKAAVKVAAAALATAERSTVSAEGALSATESSLRDLLALSKAYKAAEATRVLEAQRRQWVRLVSYAFEVEEDTHRTRNRHVSQANDAARRGQQAMNEAEPAETCSLCEARLSQQAINALCVIYLARTNECEVLGASVQTAKRLEEAAAEAMSAAREKLGSARKYAEQGISNNSVFDAEITAIEIEPESENPHMVSIRREAGRRKDLQAQIVTHKQAVSDAEVDLSLAQLGVKTFPRVKLSILARACTNLTTLTNNALAAMGMVGWSVQWSTIKELGTGDLRAKYTMTVKSPESPNWVDWRAWSGGQATKLRIAGAAAYADLVRSRLRNAPDFEFWDEPGEFLDEASGLLMMAYFRHRAHTLKRKVWLIDHNTQYAGEVDKHWIVSLDDMGSHITAA